MKSQFSVLPEQNELERFERDLRFHPTVNPRPRVLSARQIERFNSAGFLSGIRIFGDGEIAELRDYFDRLLASVIAAGGDSYSISTAHARCGRVWDILTERRIVACVKDLLGENLVAWGSHFFCKMPRDGKSVAWHQDASYWPLTPSKAVTAWLAIDDADRENACVRFIAGSHHQGRLTYRPSDPAEHNVLNQTIEDPEQYGTIIDSVLKAGEISIHSDLTLHGSEANLSNRRRCGLTLRYCATEVRAHLDWNQKGVIVSGADASGHWANRPRPAND